MTTPNGSRCPVTQTVFLFPQTGWTAKNPNTAEGHSVLTTVTVPSQHFLGSVIVDTKTNEIPVALSQFPSLRVTPG